MVDNNDKYQQMVETARAMPWNFDLKTMCFTYVGPQVVECMGYSAEEWYAENFWGDHLHPEDRDQALAYCETEASQGRDHEFEYRMLAKDGRIVWVRDVVNVIQDENGPYGLQGFMFDITERKQVEVAMNLLAEIQITEDIESFYRACVKMLASVYGAQFSFIGLFANEQRNSIQTQSLWAGNDYPANFEYDLEGTPCADIIDLKRELIPSDAAKEYPDDEMLVQMGVESYFGSPLVTPSGEMVGLVSVLDVKPMELSAWTGPILSLFAQRIASEVERYRINCSLKELNRDLEKRVDERTADLNEARKAANEASRAKSEFLSRMSHELRTPLNVIMGYSHIAERLSDDENVNKHLKEINSASNHLMELIKDVMDLSRIETGDIQINITKVNLREIIEESEKFLSKDASKNKVTMSLLDCQDNIYVKADSLRLKEVIINLLSNAIKYNHRKGSVDIHCHHVEGDIIRIEVIDTGKGLREEQIKNLFQPFSRLGAEFTEIEGTGVGLVIAKSLVERMNGTLTVSSTPNKGSCFAITIPRYTEAQSNLQ